MNRIQLIAESSKLKADKKMFHHRGAERRDQKTEVRGQRSKVRGQRSEVFVEDSKLITDKKRFHHRGAEVTERRKLYWSKYPLF